MIANFNHIKGNDQLVPRWKRALDVSLIILTLPLILLVGGAIALLIRIVSPGPIFYRQERVGHLGRRFMLVKFRTMHVGADALAHQGHTTLLMRSDAPMVKLDPKDARIIPMGAWIRALGLDELPQLLNVLRGEMTLVGPRPCLPFEFEQYRAWRMERFNTLPGLTGLWQVSGKNNTTFHEMVQLDIEYARTKSLALDLEIMLRTPLALINQVLDLRDHRKQGTIPVTIVPQPAFSTINCRTVRRNTTFHSRNSKAFGRHVRPIVGPF